ncbi:hypothetical protein D3C80_1594870 [compost metagenome]
MAIRAFEAEACANGKDQLRIDLFEIVVSKTHALHHAGAEIVHDDIGMAKQFPNDIARLLVLQIDGQAALVAVQ